MAVRTEAGRPSGHNMSQPTWVELQLCAFTCSVVKCQQVSRVDPFWARVSRTKTR